MTGDSNLTLQRLRGDWQVCPVPLDSAVSSPDEAAGPWQAIPECSHLQPALYPDESYRGAAVRFINESAWLYRRDLTLPAAAFRRARLRFEGVDYYASVWLNGQYLGDHEGHFAPFEFDITSAVRNDEPNRLVVRVSSPWDPPNPGGIPPCSHVIRRMVKGLYEHADGILPPDVNPIGIWRPTWLVLDQGVSLDRLRIETETSGVVRLRFAVTNATGQPFAGRLHLRVAGETHDGPGIEAAAAVTLPPGESHLTQTLAIPEPRLWWPWDHGEANLYRLAARLLNGAGQAISELDETFGLRTVTLERAPEGFIYRINGRPVFVRGTSYMPGFYFSQVSRAALARDIQLARDAHLNLLRAHIHVSPPDFYDLCDRLGMLVWQDFELNWAHEYTPAFEARALSMQRDMIDLLGNHPSVMTWACHNEPTLIFTQRQNLEQRPDPALYDDARQQDSTRPVFLCSGQMESDWQRAGDSHSYYGAIWSRRFTDVYRHRPHLSTEFGFEAPAAVETLRRDPAVWSRMDHLDGHIEALWDYQARLIQYHVEHFRRLRAEGGAGYIHFWLADLVPQVGPGVLDSARCPKGGYAALRQASAPLHVAMEYDPRPRALWIFNDTPQAHPGMTLHWRVYGPAESLLLDEQRPVDVAANESQRAAAIDWAGLAGQCQRVELELRSRDGQVLASNVYDRPFDTHLRPRGYPWKFDAALGMKVFDRPGAPSLADQGAHPLVKRIPAVLRERLAEWVLRQHLPVALVSRAAALIDLLT